MWSPICDSITISYTDDEENTDTNQDNNTQA